MTAEVGVQRPDIEVRRPDVGLPRTWVGMSVAAAVLSAAGSLVGLLAPARVYGQETRTLADAAGAQDLVGLLVVAPLLVVLAVGAGRGAPRPWSCLMGCLAFTVYNYAIYAFSIHFGPLFLLWVAVLALSLFSLVGAVTAVQRRAPADRVDGVRWVEQVRWVGWFLIAVAGLFALLWLSEIVPDALAGRPSTSATTWRVPTNPVHVLDLGFFLPAVLVSGVSLLRRHRLGSATAAGQLVFLALTCLPILVTPAVAQARDHPAAWSVVGPVGVLFTATALVLWRSLRAVPERAVEEGPHPGITAGR